MAFRGGQNAWRLEEMDFHDDVDNVPVEFAGISQKDIVQGHGAEAWSSKARHTKITNVAEDGPRGDIPIVH